MKRERQKCSGITVSVSLLSIHFQNTAFERTAAPLQILNITYVWLLTLTWNYLLAGA